ncbi:MAG: arylsulfatase [Ilumatobacteraceae bacterium]
MRRPEHFEGDRARTVADATPHWDDPPTPPAGSPNVVVILLDDTGFAQLGCFGSDIDTPNIDALAATGLRFTDFHVTPLCSPTRAALLTGRANHAVGMRFVSNIRTGFPNQLGHISNHATTMAEVLGAAGYATFCTGKWHLAPMEQCSAAGPFDQWPLARGFDRFYGFLDGETDQFHPDLVADNHMVAPPSGPDDGYHLSADLVDRALGMITDSVSIRPDRPFFLYLPFGATHAPHQAPAEYVEKYRGRFDDGWDITRQRWFERQVAMGIVPEHTQLAPHNPGVRPWDELDDVEQRLAARLQEAFAGFLDHTDTQIGRLVAGLQRLGRLDNTVIMLLADNGASQEGGPYGVMHEMKFFNGILETPEQAIERIDDIGGPLSHTNYPWGWAQCGNTPFRWYKQNTHEGGVHVPLVVHWPAGIAAEHHGALRHGFVHASDIAPTIYDIVGVASPDTYHGIAQLPVTGHRFTHMLNDADAPSENRVQYFENAGSRALIADGWKAVCRHTEGDDFDTEAWELYDLGADPSECNDLALEHPERLSELIAQWWEQAERHGVLPLDDRHPLRLFGARFRDGSPHPENRRYVYHVPMSPIPAQATAPIGGRNFDLIADITTDPDTDGVLYATGTANAGISIFVQEHRVVVDYNAFFDHTVLTSTVELSPGRHEVTVRFRRSAERSADMEVLIDGEPAGSTHIPFYMSTISSVGSSTGCDVGSAVSNLYTAPFAFTGNLHSLVIQLAARRSADADAAAARAEMSRQ